MVLVAVVLPIQSLVTATPGAQASTHGPQFENVAFLSVLSLAATVNAAGARAGEKSQALLLLLPAATATNTPDSIRWCTASSSACVLPPPSDMFATDLSTT